MFWVPFGLFLGYLGRLAASTPSTFKADSYKSVRVFKGRQVMQPVLNGWHKGFYDHINLVFLSRSMPHFRHIVSPSSDKLNMAHSIFA